MTQLKSDYNGVVLAKPSHLSDKEWLETAQSLKESHGGRLFSNHVAKESAKGLHGVPASEHIEFEADRKKRTRAEKPTEENVVE